MEQSNLIHMLVGVRNLLLGEIVLWTANYALDLSQLPRLFRWEIREDGVSAVKDKTTI